MEERRAATERRQAQRGTGRRATDRRAAAPRSILEEIPWRLVVPMVVLGLISAGSWRYSQSASIDETAQVDFDYPVPLDTPLLSARRIPETLQQPIADAALAPEFTTILDGSGPASCLVVNEGDRTLHSTNAQISLVPASNQKILTTYAALSVFSPARTFQTHLASADPLQAGRITGDLYLVGGGDPFLVTDDFQAQYGDAQEGRTSTRLETLADAAIAEGLTEVTGAIIGDESLFDDLRYGPWAERLIVSHQSGPLSALTVNEGFSAWPEEFAGSFRGRTAAENPAQNAAAVFAGLLAERGVSIGEASSVGTAPPQAITLARLASAPLSEIVTHINSYSNNYGAEVLVKHLALETEPQGTTASGANQVLQVLVDQGFELGGVRIDDGSGLAESNRLTCGLIAQILESPRGQSLLVDTLSIGGERGSIALRHDGTPADGQVFAKTGTLNGVTALSGVVESSSEEDVELVFTYIVNGESVGLNEELKGLQIPFVEALAAYPDAPLIASLSPR